MIVNTSTGSVYRIDPETQTWERVCVGEKSGHLRTESGVFESITGPVIGDSMVLVCPPLSAAVSGRLIQTSAVTSIT